MRTRHAREIREGILEARRDIWSVSVAHRVGLVRDTDGKVYRVPVDYNPAEKERLMHTLWKMTQGVYGTPFQRSPQDYAPLRLQAYNEYIARWRDKQDEQQ